MFKESKKGLWHRDRDHLIFFGNSSITKSDLEVFFGKKLCSLHQTHSDIAHEAFLDEELKGDAHFSSKSDLGLLVKTADCIPLLLTDGQSGYSFAIHAGWRGVAQKILESSLETLFNNVLFETPPEWTAYIGPHIQKKSFEVGRDVAAEILKSVKDDKKTTYLFDHPTEKSKCFVDLNLVMRQQLHENSISDIVDVSIDTYTDLSFASYRRDKGAKQRNWSLIYKITNDFDLQKWEEFLRAQPE